MGRERLARVLHLASELLHLLPGCRDLLRLDGAKVLILLFQAFEALLCLRNLPLQSIVLILRDCAVLERLVCLLGGFLQCIQLLLGGIDLLLECLIFLGQKLRIAGVHLQEFVDVLQFGLRVFDLGVDTLEAGFELCGVAPDFNCDAFDPASCQGCLPPFINDFISRRKLPHPKVCSERILNLLFWLISVIL